MHTVQKEQMTTIKQLNNDLIAMEKQGLIKKAGYEYNLAGEPEQRFELTQAGDDKFWAFELANLSDADKTTLERSGYGVTAEGLKLYIEETQR
jgi:hypothetical protein